MKHIFLPIVSILLLLCACGATADTIDTTTACETTSPSVMTTAPVLEPTTLATEPTEAPIDLPQAQVSTEDMISYFQEVCLDAEFENSGDSSLLQKWTEPIYYKILGQPTEADLDILCQFCEELNTIHGFPGIYPVDENATQLANLCIHFCTEEEFLNILGENFGGCDGGVTFFYDDNNRIYDATICCRTDLDQQVRNSVILEEIYNGLGPVQDTWLRQDSLIYAGYSTPQWMTQIDKVILQLLYHPDMKCGMNAEQCAAVIRSLYQENTDKA